MPSDPKEPDPGEKGPVLQAGAAGETEAELLGRREASCYRWNCIFLLLAIFLYLSTDVFDWATRRGITGSTKERFQKLEELNHNRKLFEIAVIICILAFLISFAKWLQAVRRRPRIVPPAGK